jgi:hypothetical protein
VVSGLANYLEHRFLSQSGVDCVKTDVQCRIDELMYGADKALLWKAYQDALTKGGEKQQPLKEFGGLG